MKVNLSATKFNRLVDVQDFVHNLMMLTDEDTRNVATVDGKVVDKQKFHDIMSCISASIEELVENYYDLFD